MQSVRYDVGRGCCQNSTSRVSVVGCFAASFVLDGLHIIAYILLEIVFEVHTFWIGNGNRSSLQLSSCRDKTFLSDATADPVYLPSATAIMCGHQSDAADHMAPALTDLRYTHSSIRETGVVSPKLVRWSLNQCPVLVAHCVLRNAQWIITFHTCGDCSFLF